MLVFHCLCIFNISKTLLKEKEKKKVDSQASYKDWAVQLKKVSIFTITNCINIEFKFL